MQTPAAETSVPQNQVSVSSQTKQQDDQQNLIRELQTKLVAAEEAKKQLETSLFQLQAQFSSLKNSSEAEKSELQGKFSEAQKLSNDLQTKLASVQAQQQTDSQNLKMATEQLQQEKEPRAQLQKQFEELKVPLTCHHYLIEPRINHHQSKPAQMIQSCNSNSQICKINTNIFNCSTISHRLSSALCNPNTLFWNLNTTLIAQKEFEHWKL